MLTDALGSVLALADEVGQLRTTYRYEPYGATAAQGEASGNAFQYTGRENDGTGLYYYRARYYHPGLGRFMAEDPIGLAGGINAYRYVEGNPISQIDPLGLCPMCVIPALPYIPEAVIIGATWWYAQNAQGPERDGPSVPIDLPGKIPDFDFKNPGQCPIDGKGNKWPWRGKPPQGGSNGGYKNPNGPESLHPDLGHGGNIGPHWDFNDRNGPGYRISPNVTIWPK